MELTDSGKQFRQRRVGRYKVWLLQKRLAELSAQVEASVLEARQLILWKQSHQPLAIAELSDEDRRILEHNHRIRLAEVVQRHCSGALKSITQHKWAFPFNNPVDTTRFPDYPKVITQPMDFSTIKARQDGGFYRDPKEWWADIMLVFANAKRYNAPGSDCYLMAQTLQEVSEEKYEKLIAPRLAEEAAATLRDEMYLKKKRAEAVNQQIAEAMDVQCSVLFNLMAELQGAIREAKMMAASLCDPLTLEEKQALAAAIQGLPTAQLESVVAFVASRHPPSVSQSEAQPGAGAAAGAAPGTAPPGSQAPTRKVQLNLGRYDPLLLRQLQHLVGTCTATTTTRQQQQAQQQPFAGVASAQMPPPQRPQGSAQGPPPQTAAGAAAAAGAQDASAGANPAAVAAAHSPGRNAPSPAQSPVAADNGAGGSAGEGPPGGPVQQAGQPAGDASGPQQEGGAAQQQQQQQPQTGTAVTGPAAAGAAAAGAAAQTAPGTQRNISDVVTNATASGISMRAGIRWPGLAIGAGVRARSRALLSLSYEGMPTAGDLVAACPAPQPSAPRPTGPRTSGVKRRRALLLARQEEEGRAAARQGRTAPAANALQAQQQPLPLSNGGPNAAGSDAGSGPGGLGMEVDAPGTSPSA